MLSAQSLINMKTQNCVNNYKQTCVFFGGFYTVGCIWVTPGWAHMMYGYTFHRFPYAFTNDGRFLQVLRTIYKNGFE